MKVISIRLEVELEDTADETDIQLAVEEADRAVRHLPGIARVRLASHVTRKDPTR